MPALVIREVAHWIAERGGQVVAGTPPALERAVEGVVRPRRFLSRDLDALEEHDLVITSIDAFPPGTDFTLDALVATLAEAQAGLIVAGLPPREAATDATPYRAADSLAFPLITMPFAIDLAALARDLGAFLGASERATERLVRDVQGALRRAHHENPSLSGLVAACAEATNLTCIIEDEHRVLLTLALPPAAPYDEATVTAALASYAARRAIRPATPAGSGEDIPIQRRLPGDLARAVVPIMADGATSAYLALLGPDAALTPRVVALLWRIAPQFNSAIQHVRAQLAAARPAPDLLRLAADQHIDLAAPALVALAQPLTAAAHWLPERIEDLARATPPYWATAWHDALALLLPESRATDEALSPLLALLAADQSPGVVALGLGRPATGLAGVQQSLRDAEQALRAAARQPDRRVVRYADLGVLRLILPLQSADAATLADFCRDTLAPLIRADAHHDDALLLTLEAYFAANGNLTEAARRLKLHRNTLMYRLRRITDLLGTSLDDPDLRLALQLALKIHRMTP
jgi:hypothetical protein